MARPPPAGSVCVHCAQPHDVLNWDHGVPLSWYPSGSATNEPRIKAPSCLPCNSRLSKLEQEAFLPLALSTKPADPRAAGVKAAALRAMDPSAARDERDRRARAALREKVRAAVFVPASPLGELPGCGADGRSAEALPVRGEAIEAVCIKIARVAYWSKYAEILPMDAEVSAHIVHEGVDVERIDAMIRAGEVIDVPPGVFVAVRRAADAPQAAALFVVDLWGQIRVFMSAVAGVTSSP